MGGCTGRSGTLRQETPNGTTIRSEARVMQKETESKPDLSPGEAAKQVAGAHALLKVLEEKIGQHPEIGQAIHKLDVALNLLGIETGGLL